MKNMKLIFGQCTKFCLPIHLGIIGFSFLLLVGCKNPTADLGSVSIIGEETGGLEQLDPIPDMTLENPPTSPNSVTTPTVKVFQIRPRDRVAVYSDSTCTNELVSKSWDGDPIDTSGRSTLSITLPPQAPGNYQFYSKRFWDDQKVSSPCSQAFVSYVVTPSLTVTGLVDDSVPTQSKLWSWSCVGQETTCEYRFVVNQNPTHTFSSEVYSPVATATQPSGDGLYYIHVQARDATFTDIDSSVSSASALLDNTIPTVSFTFSPDIISSTATSYTVLGSCSEEGQTVSYDIGGLTGTDTCLVGAWSSGLVNVSGLVDGAVTITADTTDVAGNVATQASVTVTKSSTPVVTISSFTNITATNETSYSFSGLCSNNGLDVILGLSSSGGGGPLARTVTCSSGAWNSGTIDVSALLDGTITLTADHSTAPQDNQTVTKDVLSPTIIITSSDSISTQNETAYVLSGACSEDTQNVNYDIGGITGTVVCTGGGWTTGFVDVSSLTDGGIAITADHSTAPQATTSVVKDTNVPTVFSLQGGEVLSESIGLSWSITNPNNEVVNDYIINYRVKGTPTFLGFADGVSTDRLVTVTGLSPSTTYEFKVNMVYATSQTSADSNILEVTTQPDDPLFGPNVAINVGGATESIVVAAEDNTTITLNSGFLVTLQAGDRHEFVSAPFDVIDADKPIYTNGKKIQGGNIGDAPWMPSSWAGKEFSFNATRNANTEIFIFAIEDASVEVRSGPTILATTTLTAGNSGSLNWATLGSYQIYSTGSILLFSQNNNLVDTKPVLPASNEIIGFPSSSMRVTSILDNTNYNLVHSNSTTGFGSLSQITSQQVNPQNCGNGTSLYRSCTLLINSDQKISGASYADSNGGNAAPFLPTGLMKRYHFLPANADYVAFASKEAGTISILDSSDRVTGTLTLAQSGAQPGAPFQARIGMGEPGQRFLSSVPVGAWYQGTASLSGLFGVADSDETIMYGTNEIPQFKPSMSTIATQGGLADQQVGPIGFTITDFDSNLDCLTSLTASSDNLTLIAGFDVSFSGTAPNCTFTLDPQPGQLGLANLTFSVTDGTYTINQSFSYSVSGGLLADTGSYRFPDTSAATSCLAYLQSSDYAGEGDGTYWIDPDGVGGDPEYEAFCDMTTQGGGWTLVIKYDRDLASPGVIGLAAGSGRQQINPGDLLNLNATGNLSASLDIRPLITNGASHFMHIGKSNDGVNNSSTYMHTYFSDIYQSVIDDPDRLFDPSLDTDDAEAVAGTIVVGTDATRKDRWYDANFVEITGMFDIDSTSFPFRLDGGEGLAMFTNGSREGAVYSSGNSSTAAGHGNPLVHWGFPGKDGSVQNYGGDILVGTHCDTNECVAAEQINLMFVR